MRTELERAGLSCSALLFVHQFEEQLKVKDSWCCKAQRDAMTEQNAQYFWPKFITRFIHHLIHSTPKFIQP